MDDLAYCSDAAMGSQLSQELLLLAVSVLPLIDKDHLRKALGLRTLLGASLRPQRWTQSHGSVFMAAPITSFTSRRCCCRSSWLT